MPKSKVCNNGEQVPNKCSTSAQSFLNKLLGSWSHCLVAARSMRCSPHFRTISVRLVLFVDGLGAGRREDATPFGALVTSTTGSSPGRSDSSVSLAGGGD